MVQQLLEQLAAAAGIEDSAGAADQLHLVVEGAIQRAASGQGVAAAASAQALATELVASSTQ